MEGTCVALALLQRYPVSGWTYNSHVPHVATCGKRNQKSGNGLSKLLEESRRIWTQLEAF